MLSVAEDDHELLIHLPLPPKRVMTPSFQPSYLKQKKWQTTAFHISRGKQYTCCCQGSYISLHASYNLFSHCMLPAACFLQHDSHYMLLGTAIKKTNGKEFSPNDHKTISFFYYTMYFCTPRMCLNTSQHMPLLHSKYSSSPFVWFLGNLMGYRL